MQSIKPYVPVRSQAVKTFVPGRSKRMSVIQQKIKVEELSRPKVTVSEKKPPIM